jgi:putative methanogenesis marker protein 3
MTILKAIQTNKAPYDENCLVLVSIPEKKQPLDKKIHREYIIETTQGPISFSLLSTPFLKDLIVHYYIFEGIKVGWLSKDTVTFGPVDMSFIKVPVNRDPVNYKTYDVFLSFGGFDPANLHLCISKKDHAGLYGAPDEPLHGVVGRIIQGGHIIPMLRKTDSILKIGPLTQLRKRTMALRFHEIEIEPVTPEMEIYTYLPITLHKEAKNSIDHFLSNTNSKFFTVNQASSMYIKNNKFQGVKIIAENQVFRPKGAITIRNSGNDEGSIYIYKNDTSFNKAHNVIGRADPNFLPLIENANPNDTLLIKTNPMPFIFIGKTQKYASDYLQAQHISHTRVGNESDDAIIVEQRPTSTFDVWLEKTCVTLGLDPSQIIKIKFDYANSPRTIEYFRKIANMLFFPIGKLQVLQNLKTLVLFIQASGAESIQAIPRESAFKQALAGDLGVTNALRRLTGTIGIRLQESDTYGPTGESLEGTNIIGQILSGLDFLEKSDTGDIVWFMEVKEPE